MTVIFSQGNVKWPTPHDPNDAKYYYLHYRPANWVLSTTYYINESVVSPTVSNGCIYKCVKAGKSGTTEPTWLTDVDSIIKDGSIEWLCLPDNCILRPGDTISSSAWSGTAFIEFDGIVDNITTRVRVSEVPAGLSTITLINTIVIARSNSDTEIRERSITITVKEL